MNKILLTTLIIFIGSYTATAQVPQYKHSSFDTAGPTSSIVYLKNTANHPLRLQAYYYPTDFPGMKSGGITSLYYRTGSASGMADTIAYGGQLGIKVTRDSLFALDSNGYGSLSYVADTFMSLDGSIAKGMGTRGQWKQIHFSYPLLYCYDNKQNILLDFLISASESFSWMCSKAPVGKMIVHQPDSLHAVSEPSLLDIGFDIETPQDVTAFSNVRSLGLFPIPTADGRFNISCELAAPAKTISISAADAVGKMVYSSAYQNPGKSFFQEISLSTKAKGIYFLKIVVDGESIVRRVILE